jgi:electron transfer flavoprotein alpha subunit
LSSLVILEHREGKLQNTSLNSVTAAHKLGGSITGFIAGGGVKSLAEEAAEVNGLDKIIMVENAAYNKVFSRWYHSCLPALKAHSLDLLMRRACRRTSPLSSLRILRKGIHMCLPVIQHSAKILCHG